MTKNLPTRCSRPPHATRPTLKKLLLAPHGRFEISIPKRGGLLRRGSRETT
jgi:hypothetical protein